jgi:hypothetical protein
MTAFDSRTSSQATQADCPAAHCGNPAVEFDGEAVGLGEDERHIRGIVRESNAVI